MTRGWGRDGVREEGHQGRHPGRRDAGVRSGARQRAVEHAGDTFIRV